MRVALLLPWALGAPAPLPPLFALLDVDSSGALEHGEFVAGLDRLRWESGLLQTTGTSIFVKLPTGKVRTIDVERATTFGELKTMIHDHEKHLLPEDMVLRTANDGGLPDDVSCLSMTEQLKDGHVDVMKGEPLVVVRRRSKVIVLFVRTSTGKTLTIYIERATTFGELKDKIHDHENHLLPGEMVLRTANGGELLDAVSCLSMFEQLKDGHDDVLKGEPLVVVSLRAHPLPELGGVSPEVYCEKESYRKMADQDYAEFEGKACALFQQWKKIGPAYSHHPASLQECRNKLNEANGNINEAFIKLIDRKFTAAE